MQRSLSPIITEGSSDDGNGLLVLCVQNATPILRQAGGWHEMNSIWKGPAMSRASSYSRPSCYLLLLLALRVGLIALLACTLGMLLSTLRMLHALCLIALAVLLSGGTVRFCRVFVEFGGFVVIAVRHLRFLKFNSQRETICQTLTRSQTSRNGVGCALFHLEPRGISSHKLRMAP